MIKHFAGEEPSLVKRVEVLGVKEVSFLLFVGESFQCLVSEVCSFAAGSQKAVNLKLYPSFQLVFKGYLIGTN